MPVVVLVFQMNPQAFDTLEFDELRDLVRRGAQTAMGRALVGAMSPIDDLPDLRHALQVVAEMIDLRQRGARLGFDEIADPTDSISRLRIEGTALEPVAILNLASWCERAMDARAAILAEREACPALFEMVAAQPVDAPEKRQILLDRQIAIETERLIHIADRAFDLLRLC